MILYWRYYILATYLLLSIFHSHGNNSLNQNSYSFSLVFSVLHIHRLYTLLRSHYIFPCSVYIKLLSQLMSIYLAFKTIIVDIPFKLSCYIFVHFLPFLLFSKRRYNVYICYIQSSFNGIVTTKTCIFEIYL